MLHCHNVPLLLGIGRAEQHIIGEEIVDVILPGPVSCCLSLETVSAAE